MTVARRFPRVLASLLIAGSLVTPGMTPPVEAAGQTRTLKLYFVHTNEKAEITFKRNGRYDPKGLQQINRFLRDWRRNEPTKMDPRLLDLVWEVYQKSGSHDYIHVVSAYRSPATNAMLRSRSKLVAQKSQHMLGKAMDFYLTDVKLKTLREIGMKFQVGGVGYYPTSGSPFVHMDVGGVRAWPRMSRSELVRLFPDGKTMHLPSDGKPLPGYQMAIADYKRRVGANAIEVAGGGSNATDTKSSKRRGNLFAMLFGGGDEDEEPNAISSSADTEVADAQPAVKETPVLTQAEPVQAQPVLTQTALAGVEVAAAPEDRLNAPVPLVRPAFKDIPADGGVEVALVSPTRTKAEEALTAAMPDPAAATSEYADLTAYKIPVPQMLGKRPANGDAASEETLVAAADAQNALTEDSETLGFVPVPALRPAGEAALIAVAQANVVVPSFAQRADPLVMAKLPEPVEAEAEAKVAFAQPTPENTVRPVEMAAFVPQPTAANRVSAFDSTFETQDVAAPAKGKRPNQEQATAAIRTSVRTEPKLTEKIISEWALSTSRMATLSKPVKAPRFVSKALRESPTTVYSAGFTSGPVAIDTARFSGTAVNFMEVKKFSTN